MHCAPQGFPAVPAVPAEEKAESIAPHPPDGDPMPKAVKIIVFDERTQAYPVDEAEDIWHIWRDGAPVAELQFTVGPTAVDAAPDRVIQDDPDYICIEPPPGHEQVFKDCRTRNG